MRKNTVQTKKKKKNIVTNENGACSKSAYFQIVENVGIRNRRNHELCVFYGLRSHARISIHKLQGAGKCILK